jgi:hypothetical protein
LSGAVDEEKDTCIALAVNDQNLSLENRLRDGIGVRMWGRIWPVLGKNWVQMDIIASCDELDFKEMGISKGDRMGILKVVRRMQEEGLLPYDDDDDDDDDDQDISCETKLA